MNNHNNSATTWPDKADITYDRCTEELKISSLLNCKTLSSTHNIVGATVVLFLADKQQVPPNESGEQVEDEAAQTRKWSEVPVNMSFMPVPIPHIVSLTKTRMENERSVSSTQKRSYSKAMGERSRHNSSHGGNAECMEVSDSESMESDDRDSRHGGNREKNSAKSQFPSSSNHGLQGQLAIHTGDNNFQPGSMAPPMSGPRQSGLASPKVYQDLTQPGGPPLFRTQTGQPHFLVPGTDAYGRMVTCKEEPRSPQTFGGCQGNGLSKETSFYPSYGKECFPPRGGHIPSPCTPTQSPGMPSGQQPCTSFAGMTQSPNTSGAAVNSFRSPGTMETSTFPSATITAGLHLADGMMTDGALYNYIARMTNLDEAHEQLQHAQPEMGQHAQAASSSSGQQQAIEASTSSEGNRDTHSNFFSRATFTKRASCSCGICSREITNYDSFMLHISLHKPFEGQKLVHKCPVCQKQFARYQGLYKHMSIHVTKDLYICPYCNHSYDRLEKFRYHFMSNHPGRESVFEEFKKYYNSKIRKKIRDDNLTYKFEPMNN